MEMGDTELQETDKITQFTEEMASDDVQPISDSTSRSDWFRQTVLFWSSQTTSSNYDGSEQALNENGNPDLTSDLSSTGSTCSLSLNNSHEERTDEGDYLLDLDITTSELLKQVEEFEHCFSELTKNDDALIIKNENSINRSVDEDSYYSTLESDIQSPHLTLEFPAGSSIRDSPLYKISDAVAELGNKMDCSAECTAGEEKMRSMMKEESIVNNLDNKCLITETETCVESMHNNATTISESVMCDRDGSQREMSNISKDNRGDPNDVLRDLLSGIKPPNGVCVSATPSPRNSLQSSSITQGHDVVPELPIKESKPAEICNEKDEVFLPDTKRVEGKSDVLLKQMDNLLQMEHRRTAAATPSKRKSLRNSHEKLERLDSGLNGMSSDSNSPYPSPLVTRSPPSSESHHHKSPGYDSGYIEQPIRKTTETIYESTKENEWDFHDDSDLSSDWSPLSTIDSADFSAASSKRSRSYSVPHTSQFAPPSYHSRRTSTGNNGSQKKRANSTALSYPRCDGSSADAVYSESELSAIRKFLTLTRKYFDKGTAMCSKESGACLDGLAMIPNINEIVEAQSKEVRDQREMLEGFIRQLGELLIEIVNLKEEQTAVRSKQAKALTLLKKQLDHHKKNQNQACSDILEQVNLLNEKLGTSSTSSEQLSSTPITKNGSVKSIASSKTPSSPATPKSKSLSTSSMNSTTSLSPLPSLRSNNYGHIIWKITDVMRKITRIKSGVIDGTLVSPPFQTGEYQYNMNAWVYLNGRGKMVGKYFSVYACVLVGEYDAILPWPVTPTYRFTLIDQRSDPTKRQDHVRVRRVLDIAGRGENVISQNGGIPRPSDGSKALIVGLDDFIAHDQLLKNRYLVDDVIFLKVEAEIN